MILFWKSYKKPFEKNQTASCSFFCTSDKLVHRRDDASIEQIDDPVGETGIVLGVSHHDDRGPFPVQFGEQLHHFGSVLRVQVTGRLIGEDDLRIRWPHAAAVLRKAAAGNGPRGG